MRLFTPDAPRVEPGGCAAYRAARRWVARRLGGVAHEDAVSAAAAALFDLTRPLHALNRADRRLLRLGAMVHDVGRCVCDDEHPAEGAWMILADRALPLGAAERRALAYFTLYHRGAVPDAGADDILRPADDHARLRVLLALLRAADALDSRKLDAPRLAFALAGRRKLQITCHLREVCARAEKVYGRRKKFRMLEELLGVRVEVDVACGKALRMVA